MVMISTYLSQIQSLTHGMDVVIISVTSPYEANFWQNRLDKMRGQVVKNDALILTVHEDWPKGAGNALGTFYAFQKAKQMAQEKFGVDLFEAMQKGLSIALYHTAGKGTRLAPMTGCEYNNKSRIKLIGRLFDKSKAVPITILEAVIKQTSIFAPHRKGRLSVFWGDQIFIPSHEIKPAVFEIDLLVQSLANCPSQQDWQNQGYDKYGMVIVEANQQAKQLEKLSYENFSKLAGKEKLAFSLGCFSLSKKILAAFLKEFEAELQNKNTALDTDPHLWMPLTLEKDLYIELLTKKNVSKDFAEAHYERMQNFKKKLLQVSPFLALFGVTDVGAQSLWWDYGNTKSYYDNCLKLTQQSDEAKFLKTFFSVTDQIENHAQTDNLTVDNSILINCCIRKGSIKNSVLINVIADEVNCNQSIMINSCGQKITADQAIVYHALENGNIDVLTHQIRADNFSKEKGHIRLYNLINANFSWDELINNNPLTFEQLHLFNQEINPDHGLELAQSMHNRIKQSVFDLQE